MNVGSTKTWSQGKERYGRDTTVLGRQNIVTNTTDERIYYSKRRHVSIVAIGNGNI